MEMRLNENENGKIRIDKVSSRVPHLQRDSRTSLFACLSI